MGWLSDVGKNMTFQGGVKGAIDPFGIFGGGGGDEEDRPPTMLDIAQQFGPAAQEYFNTMKGLAPQEGQLGLDMLKQFGLPMAQERYNVANQLYPYTTGLQEKLAQQASEGINAGLTPNELRIVQDAIRGSLGSQATSGLGVNRLSGSILDSTRARQSQYQNMGMQLTGRMPLYQAETPYYSNFLSQFTPGQAMEYGLGAYELTPEMGNPLMALLGTAGGLAIGSQFGDPLRGAELGAKIGTLFA